jgi:hypothetical protein
MGSVYRGAWPVSREEALTLLRDSGYGVVEDALAVIVIDYKPHDRLSLSATTATRYDSPEAAVKRLKLDGEES